MTFNLRVDIEEDGRNAWHYRRKKVPHMISKHRPLIVGTQEALLRMIEDIKEELPEYKWIGEGRRGGENDEFCAIFYNQQILEVVEAGQFWLSEDPNKPNSISWQSDFPRICTWGHFRFKSDRKAFIVYNTHLDHISQPARENGIHLIWKKLSKHVLETKLPIILTGDFNSKPDNQVIRFLCGETTLHGDSANLQDVFKKLKGIPRATFHNFSGGSKGLPIDYIFTDFKVDILDTEIDMTKVDGAYPSDHYPVITTLKV